MLMSVMIKDSAIMIHTMTLTLNVMPFKGNGDHSEVRDKFCSNFQNMLIRSL